MTMQRFENQLFELWFDRDSGSAFTDIEFIRCRFRNCHLSMTDDPRRRSTARSVVLRDCSVNVAAGLSPAVLEDIFVDGLHGEYEMKTWGAVFKHVTLRGRIGPVLIISNAVAPFDPPEVQDAFEKANAAYYQNVDWALDISQAEFDDCDIRGIPSRLIRRDPETQAVVMRAAARRGNWREMNFGKAEWVKAALQSMLDWGNDDVILIAGKRAKDFRATVQAIELLRREGIAEPD